MRIFKFRAWDKWQNKMIQPNNGDFIGWHAMSNWDKCLEVMQYTGLNDKNGQEVYEKDIIKEGESIGVIEFVDGRFIINWILNKDFWSETLMYHIGNAEIIGNAFENPELLKV